MITKQEIKDGILKISRDYITKFSLGSIREYEETVANENKLKDQYRGREIFELLQNIDDALKYSGDKERVASFELRGKNLTVSNNGAPFTMETLERLCQGNVSSKSLEFIGNKGIGFRSVLNWTDNIKIYSGSEDYISVGFSSEYAAEQLTVLKNEGPEVAAHIEQQEKDLREKKKINPSFPIMMAPRYIKPIEKDYDTVISFHIEDPDVIESIKNDIRNFDDNVILFLPNIREIRFRVEGEEDLDINIRKETVAPNVVTVSGARGTQSFYFDSKTGRLKEKYKETKDSEGTDKVKLAVAIPVEFQRHRNYHLYTFFPLLEVKSPFEALLHATFCVTDNRNEFDRSNSKVKSVNREVTAMLLKFYVDCVTKFVEGPDRLKYLCPVNPDNLNTNNFDFRGEISELTTFSDYKDLLRGKKILFSVNGLYVSSTNNRLILLEESPKWFKGSGFDFLVSGFSEKRWYNFALQLPGINQSDAESLLRKAINIRKDGWLPLRRVRTFKWWNSQPYNSLPELLRNNKEEFISDSLQPVFLSGGITDLPKWSGITLLHPDDEEFLLKVYREEIKSAGKEEKGKTKKENKKRLLPKVISSLHPNLSLFYKEKGIINLQEQSSKSVMISPVNVAAGRSFKRSLTFLDWLFKVWKEEGSFKENVKGIDLNLPCADREVRKIRNNHIYIDDIALNPVGSLICRQLPDYHALCLDSFRNNEDKDLLKNFLSDLNILTFPELTFHKEDKKYLSWFDEPFAGYLQNLPLPEGILNYRIDINLKYLPGLPLLLSKLSTDTILKWIFNSDLRNLLINEYEEREGFVKYWPYGVKLSRDIPGLSRFRSLLHYVFATSPWIEIDGERYSPSRLILPKRKYEVLDSLGIPKLSERLIAEWAKLVGMNPKKLREFLIGLGVRENFLELSNSEFYSLLLGITDLTDEKDIRDSRTLSHAIYKEIIENGASEFPVTAFYKDCDEKTEFFKRGKVLANSGNKKSEYRPVAEVRFSSSAVIVTKNTWLLEVPTRSGKKDEFLKILNVREPEKSADVISFSEASANREFHKDFRNFMLYFLRWIERANIQPLVSLNVSLASSIDFTTSNGEELDPDPYEPYKSGPGSWIIYLPADHDYKLLDRSKLALTISRIINVVLNSPSKEIRYTAQLVFNQTESARKDWALLEFMDLDWLPEYRTLLNSPADIKDKVKGFLVSQGADEALLRQIEIIEWGLSESVETQTAIRNLIKKAGITVEDLSKIADIPFSLRDYNLRKLNDTVSRNKENYERAVYLYLLDNKTLRKDLKHLWADFNPETIGREYDLDNETDLNTDDMLHHFLRKKGVSLVEETNCPDFENIYETSLDELRKILGSDALKEFLSEEKTDSLLFFSDELEALKEKAANFLEKINVEETQVNEDTPDTMKSLIDNLFDNSVIGKEPEPSSPHTSSGKGKGSGKVSEGKNNRNTKEKVKQGEVAELLVIRNIEEGKIIEVSEFFPDGYILEWVSGNSVSHAKKNTAKSWKRPKDASDSLGYDLRLTSLDNTKRMYLEVKSSTGLECQFPISENELSKASLLDNGVDSLYRVVFVGGLDIRDESSSPVINFLDENVTDETVFLRSPIDYHLHYQGPAIR